MNKLNESIGWFSALLLACCGIPEVIISLTTGESGLSWYFLLMWFFGEIGALIYVIGKSKEVKLWPLLFNYGLNIICITIILLCKGL